MIKIDYNKLKTDGNYRNKYLEDKKIAQLRYQLIRKKKEIEDEYRNKFEAMTFKKEQNMYEWVTRSIKNSYQRHLDLEARKNEFEIKFPFPASNEWYKEKNTFKYSASKKRLLEFIENLTGQNINDKVSMESKEYKEFQKFILEREPDYADLMDID